MMSPGPEGMSTFQATIVKWSTQMGTWIKNAQRHPIESPSIPPRGPPMAAPKALKRPELARGRGWRERGSLDDVSESLVDSTLAERNEVGGDDGRHGGESSATDTSERACGDKLRVGLGHAAGEGTEEEDDRGKKSSGLAACSRR